MDGLLIKVVDAVCRDAGISASHSGYPWARAQKLVELGELDALCTNPTDSRRQYALFCEQALVINRSTALHRKGDRRFLDMQTKADMKGITLVDYLGNKWIEAEVGHFVNFNWIKSQKQVFEVLSRGRGDAIVVSEIEGRYLLSKFDLFKNMDLTALGFFPSDHYTIGVRRSLEGAKEIVSRLDRATREAQRNGQLAKIVDGYLK